MTRLNIIRNLINTMNNEFDAEASPEEEKIVERIFNAGWDTALNAVYPIIQDSSENKLGINAILEGLDNLYVSKKS